MQARWLGQRECRNGTTGEPHLGRGFATSEVDGSAAFAITSCYNQLHVRSGPKTSGHGDGNTTSQSFPHDTDRYPGRSATSNTTSNALRHWSSISGQLPTCGQSCLVAASSISFWGQNSSPLRALDNAADGGLPQDVWILT